MEDLLTSIQEVLLDLVGFVFLLSGGVKAFSARSFREGLLYIPYMPIAATYVVAGVLPVVEVAVGVGLLFNAPAAKFAALGLIAIFCAVVAVVLARRLRVPCGCFGQLDSRDLSATHFLDNGLLAGSVLASFPLAERGPWPLSLPAAAVVLLLCLVARELLSQRRYLAGLRAQGVL